MSVLDLRAADDDELLEHLARALAEDRAATRPRARCHCWWRSTTLRGGSGPKCPGGPVQPPRHSDRCWPRRRPWSPGDRAGLGGLAPAARVVLRPGPAQDATTSLQADLAQGSDRTTVAQDVTTLARLLRLVPVSQHAQVGVQPGRVLTEACIRAGRHRGPRGRPPGPVRVDPGPAGRPSSRGQRGRHTGRCGELRRCRRRGGDRRRIADALVRPGSGFGADSCPLR